MMQRTLVTLSAVALTLAWSAGTAQNEGEAVYQQCAACHGAEGEGIGAAPALAGNQNLQEASYHISRILNGGAGMPAFRDQLSDEQIAAVATYERTSWGNYFGEVTAEQVAQERSGQATGGDEDTAGQSEAGAEAVSEERTNVEEATGTASAGQSPVNVSTEVVAEGLVSPVQLTAPEGDERRFVVDRVGRIYILNANDELVEAPFLDISDRMVELQEDFDERGLLGLAFHPNYAENGRFYV